MANSNEVEIVKKLHDTVNDFSDELKTMLASLGHADSEFDQAAKSADEYAKKVGVGMTAAIAQLGFVAWNTANEYEKALKSIQISTGASGREMQALEGSFRSVMREVPNAAAEVAGTIANLDTYTDASGETMDSLARQILDLSRMLKEDGAGNAKAFGQALSLWQRPAKDAEALLDGIFDISRDTGAGFNQLASDLNSYGASMHNAGFSMEESADFFGRLHASGISVSKVIPALNKTFQQWGGEQKDSRQELAKTIQALQDAESSADALTIATEVFGKDAAQQLVATARNGTFALDGLGASFEGAGGSIARYSDATMTLDERMQRLKNQLFQVLEPYGEKMIEQAEKAVKYFEENGPEMIAMAENVAKALAGIGIAAGTIKIGKGAVDAGAFISNLAKEGKAASTTGAGMAGISTTVRVLGTALMGLTSPVGLAVAGVGALAGGWMLYKKHQENARQELLHMGEDLEEVSSHYSTVAEDAKLTNDLVWEYQQLHDIVANNTDATRDLSIQKERLKEIEQILQQMYPEVISQYDIENDKVLEKTNLMKQEADAKSQRLKYELKKEVVEKSESLPELEEEIRKLEQETDSLIQQDDAYDKSIAALSEYEAEYAQIRDMENSPEKRAMEQELLKKVQENLIGYTYDDISDLEGLSDDLQGMRQDRNDLLNQITEKYGELETAEESYQQYYNTSKEYIDAQLGMSVEEMAKNYQNLSEAEKQAVDAAILDLTRLNEQMDMLPDERKIDINVLFKEMGIASDFETARKYYPIPEFAEGGFSDRPAIFGEAGLEAAIPINNKPRSHAILDRVNQLMGHDTGSNVQVTFAPNIRLVVGGSAQDVRSQVQSAIRESQVEFERRFREMVRQERRLSFHA